MCKTHYNRWLVYGTAEPRPKTKANRKFNDDGEQPWVLAQQYRVGREPVPCWQCGDREGCRHRAVAA